MRYLLVEKPQGLQDKTRMQIAFRAPTCAELFDRLRERRTSKSTCQSGCSYLYYPEQGVPRYELVDAFEEPGRIVRDKYWDYWVPGEPHVTQDDATTIRFKQMELS